MPHRFKFAGPQQVLRLLDAVMAIGSGQSLRDVLRGITETAAELVDARYAALGVLDETGSRLAEFITVGLTDDETTRIGARPEGHGILGLLILEPKPLRLPDLHAHPDSFGFPPGHPPMTSFLGVPIRSRGVVYGNLYLTDKADGQVFTDVDEELAVGLAAAAGVAIENARLHEQAQAAGLLDERERIAGTSTTTSSSGSSQPGCRWKQSRSSPPIPCLSNGSAAQSMTSTCRSARSGPPSSS